MEESEKIQEADWVVAPRELAAPVITRRRYVGAAGRAELQISALGFMIPYVNDRRVGDEYFRPSNSLFCRRKTETFLYPIFDELTYRCYYSTFDISDCLHSGENVLEIALGNGWYRQERRTAEGNVAFGDSLGARFAIKITDENGERTLLSDGSEICRASQIVSSDLFFGETVDYRLREFAQCPVRRRQLPETLLMPEEAPPDRVMRVLPPRLLLRKGNCAIYDAGENVMRDILTAPWMVEMIRTVTNMYDHGWDERNGCNVSLLLDKADVKKYTDGTVLRSIPTGFCCSELDGKYFLVTGTGKYFKNVQYAPEVNLGLVRLTDGGETAQLLWGFTDGGRFTSEFPAHMMSHAARLKIDHQNHVVMHCHPANLLAMTYVHSLDEKAFTRTLWQMCTECIVVFPDGVNVLPWMLCGTNEIGEATAEKMRTARLVVWAQHGIYGAGKDLDETFGLIETAEKAAEIYMKIAHLPLVNTITDEQLHQLEERFGVKAREGYLN